MGSSISQSLLLIINTLGGLYILAVIIRFLLQAARADFYNPVSQSIVKITAPLVTPLRKIIPGYKGFDFASLVLALLLNIVATSVMLLVAGGLGLVDVGTIVAWSSIGLLAFILKIYKYGLLISIIASWIAPHSGNPVLLLIHQLLEPIMKKVHKVIPPVGGLDFSPIFVFLGIQVVETMLVQGLAQSLRLFPAVVIGI
jgi:YggT family protein